MKSIRYSRFTGEDFGITAEDLMRALADYMLQSGFGSSLMDFTEFNEHTLEQLKKAIQQALDSGELFDSERASELEQQLRNMTPAETERLLEQLVQKLVEAGYIQKAESQQQQAHSRRRRPPEERDATGSASSSR
jgi:Ca-activated chloride channel family protein